MTISKTFYHRKFIKMLLFIFLFVAIMMSISVTSYAGTIYPVKSSEPVRIYIENEYHSKEI